MAVGDVNGDGVLDFALVGQFDAWVVDGATGLRTVGNLMQPGRIRLFASQTLTATGLPM